MGAPVAIAVQPEPGALGVAGVVALDADGTLLYCAPGQTPASSQLTPPDTGFGRIDAIAVTNEVLFVLDPKANAVWLYELRRRSAAHRIVSPIGSDLKLPLTAMTRMSSSCCTRTASSIAASGARRAAGTLQSIRVG
jgi:hypothetical protein